MSSPVLWSAINISEGKDLSGLVDLVAALSTKGARLADWSADPDHHRSVLSLVGTPFELATSIGQIFHWADTHIDLTSHRGEHPRLGAVDVVPFVPLSPDANTEIAHQAAQMIASDMAQKFNIPIFLYRDSSAEGSRLTLPELRRGGSARLAERMAAGELQPTYGPALPHPRLGVAVFGARTPLVAYNCVTNTKDMEIGRAIAKELRATNGGLPHVQALAFPLASRQGLVQISMNILDPEETPPHLAYLAVVEACASRGLQVLDTELIGLVPKSALEAAFKHFMKLQSFHSGQVAEWNLYSKEHPYN